MKTRVSIGYVSSLAVAPLLAAAERDPPGVPDWALDARPEIGWQSLGKKLLTGELDGALVPPVYPFVRGAETGGGSEVRVCMGFGFGGKRVVVSKALATAIEGGQCPDQIRFSTSGPLSCDGFYISQWLEGLGLGSWSKVLTPVTVAATQYGYFLHENLVDVLVCLEPWATWSQNRGFGQIIACGRRFEIDEVSLALVMRDAWLAQNPLIYSELSAHLLTQARWTAEPANAAEMAVIFQKRDRFGTIAVDRDPFPFAGARFSVARVCACGIGKQGPRQSEIEGLNLVVTRVQLLDLGDRTQVGVEFVDLRENTDHGLKAL